MGKSAFGNSDVLHTNYHYFRANEIFKSRYADSSLVKLGSDFTTLANTMKAREVAFYNIFGCSDYRDFIIQINSIKTKYKNDLLLIKNFTSENIQNTIISGITKARKGSLTSVPVEITVDLSQLNREFEKFNNIFPGGNITQDGKVSLKTELNTNTFKQLINAMEGTHFQWRRGAVYTDAIYDYISKNINRFMSCLTFTSETGVMTVDEIKDIIEYRPPNYGYTKETIKYLQADEIAEVKSNIFSDIRSILLSGASAELQDAAMEVFSLIPDEDFLFFIGGNYQKGLKGAYGEFSTALLLKFLGRVLGGFNGDPDFLGQKLTRFGEQGKVDILFQGFGFQVKNWAVNEEIKQTYKPITLTQHPAEIVENYPESFGNGENFKQFLANYYFNEDLRDHSYNLLKNVQQDLERLFTAELLQLVLEEQDMNTFYIIDSTYFVPGSVLLEHYARIANSGGEQLEPNLSIADGTHPTWPDKSPEALKDHMHGPNAYWTRSRGSWTPTGVNKSIFNQMIESSISIRFTINDFVLSDYSLFI